MHPYTRFSCIYILHAVELEMHWSPRLCVHLAFYFNFLTVGFTMKTNVKSVMYVIHVSCCALKKPSLSCDNPAWPEICCMDWKSGKTHIRRRCINIHVVKNLTTQPAVLFHFHCQWMGNSLIVVFGCRQTHSDDIKLLTVSTKGQFTLESFEGITWFHFMIYKAQP